MEAELICANCVHFIEKRLECAAFPNGIPDIIISGESAHSKPLPEQKNNIIFEPIKKKKND